VILEEVIQNVATSSVPKSVAIWGDKKVELLLRFDLTGLEGAKAMGYLVHRGVEIHCVGQPPPEFVGVQNDHYDRHGNLKAEPFLERLSMLGGVDWSSLPEIIRRLEALGWKTGGQRAHSVVRKVLQKCAGKFPWVERSGPGRDALYRVLPYPQDPEEIDDDCDD